MVRLKDSLPASHPVWVNDFNSCMVRLKVARSFVIGLSVCYFNSCMVRLKVAVRTSEPVKGLFQFLYGAIKRLTFTESFGSSKYFNSCTVRLKEA